MVNTVAQSIVGGKWLICLKRLSNSPWWKTGRQPGEHSSRAGTWSRNSGECFLMAFPLSFPKLSNATWVILPGSGPATVGVSTYIKHQSRKSFPSMSIAQPDKSHPSFEVLFFFFSRSVKWHTAHSHTWRRKQCLLSSLFVHSSFPTSLQQ